ncbi:MAG TPA: Maf family protein [Tepidisphaeraceae bacterium]|nr:Maf family protein [Tepidisphaeraceae bacterium]
MTQAASPRLILASASPRRQSLLQEAGFSFLIEPSGVSEEAAPNLYPIDLALHLAIAKADAVAAKFPDDVVLAADTVVAFGDRSLGKPADEEDARRMLRLLSGTTHVVITGVTVIRKSADHHALTHVMSAVRMKLLDEPAIARYIQGGDWRGKAGGYGIQDADPFVIRLSGCHTNVVGLPMTTTIRLLSEAGIDRRQV